MKAFGAALLVSLLPMGAVAVAQTAPLSNTADPSAALPKPVSPSTPLQTDRAPVEGVTPPSEAAPQFVLTSVRFEGGSAVPPERLAAAWNSLAGKQVTFADLRAIARNAEGIYAEEGYPFVAVVVPPQTVDGGVVLMRVVEGRISNLTVLSKDPTARRQASAAFAPLVDHQPLSLADVEGAYQQAKAVPGLALSGALRRASEPGGMDLVIQASRERWRTYLNVNNLYPKTNGPWGALFGIDYFGDSTWGDQTSLQLYSSFDEGSQYVIRLSHERRLNASGTTLSLMGLAAWANPEGVVTPLDIATDVQAARIALDQPLYDSATFNGHIYAAFEINNQKTKVFNTVGLSNDRMRIFAAGASGAWHPRNGGLLDGAIELRQGVDAFGGSKLGDADLSRFGADPQGFSIRLRSTVETPSFHTVRLYAHVEGQLTGDALTAPEQYAFGNLSIGRGYEPGAAFGDRALAVTGELRGGPYPMFGGKLQVSPFGFYDAGRLWTLTPGAHTRIDLASAGGGLRLDVPGKMHLELFYAEPLRPPVGLGAPVPTPRVFLNVTFGLNTVFQGLARYASNGDGR